MEETCTCPICLRQDVQKSHINSAVPYQGPFRDIRNDAASWFKCAACGQFVVTRRDEINFRCASGNAFNAAHVSALLREQTTRGSAVFWLQDGIDPYGELIQTGMTPIALKELLARWPRTVPERIDRVLGNMVRLSPTGGHHVTVSPNDIAFLFAHTPEEARYHLSALVNYGWLGGTIYSDLTPSSFALTPAGWAHFEELTHGASSPDKPAFVAMWFPTGEDKAVMDAAYSQGIQPAIEQAGYRVTRVDLCEHNDWIMDKVLGDIRLAPFVVADFTENRNGVYFEAGFARGLGIPVIHTCRDGHLEKAHFDTKQLNHIVWKTPDELRQRLTNRILGTIGAGPYLPQK